MAWVTTLGPDMAQVEYRLSEQCGCDMEHQDTAEPATDAQVDYRLGAAGDLEWIGRGLADVGLAAGTAVYKDAARALMDGRDPRTGEQLVRPKLAVDPRAKLPARPLVEAVEAAATVHGIDVEELLDDDKLSKRFGRLQRGVRREGDGHRLSVGDVDVLADAAGIDSASLYGPSELAEARRFADARIRIGNRGYDLTLDLPKSYSALFALADPRFAAELEEAFLEAARETVAAVEDWTVYAMAGEHGGGRTAARVATSGALGWMTVHRSARPVDGRPGDPHLHAHINIANMALAADGKWRTVAAGGRDLHRHAHAADALLKARLRELSAQRFGVRWERHPQTGAWEVVGIPEDLRADFSRRTAQVTAATDADASTAEQKLAARKLAESKDTATPAVDVRADWRARAQAVVGDVDAMVAAAAPGGPDGPAPARGGPGSGPVVPAPADVAAHIWREDGGLTAHRKVVTRADVLAAVIDACPHGLPDADAAKALTDAVLAVPGHAVPLPDQGSAHLTNAQRFTHTSVLAAEQVIVETTTARLDEGAAQLTPAAAELAVATFEAGAGFELSPEQGGVVERLLTAGHGLDVVVGVAGAGKTTLMCAARGGWEAAGLRVAGASTAAVAASNLQTEAGIEAATVAAWLADLDRGGRRLADTDVLVLDEAAMVDDRALARLLSAAAEHGVKVVAVGDPQQLKAIGIGGGFKRAHELVDGATLTENRRQTDAAERAALRVWRDGGRHTALAALAEHGRVHAVHTPEEAQAGMLGAWWDVRGRVGGDVHDQVEDLLLLAARNADVDVLNAGARELLKQAGQLQEERVFALPAGQRLPLAVGDLVRVRRNDYRTRHGGDIDVLNGFRGVVTAVGPDGVRVQWRRPGVDGRPALFEADLNADQLAAGALSHGYAMTVAAAQGLTSRYALAYGVGAEANTLYPALSRAKFETHLWLPADVVEDDATRRRLGEARTEEELLQRTVAAYAASLEGDRPDGMVCDEVAHAPAPPVPRQEPLDAGSGSRHGPDPVPHWRQRRFGDVPTGKLLTRAQAADRDAALADQRAEEVTVRAAALHNVLGTAAAPGRRAVAERLAHLEAAEHHLAAAEAAEREAHALDGRIGELYAANRRDLNTWQLIQRRAAKKSSAVTFQRGRLHRDAQALRAHVDQRTAHIQQVRAQELELTVQAAELREQARGELAAATGSTAPRRDLRAHADRLRAGLPGYIRSQDAADRSRYEQLLAQANRHRSEVAQRRVAAAGLREESAVRGRLSAGQHAAESAERTEAVRQAAERRRREQERIRALHQHHLSPRSYAPPGHGRGGPGLGR
ncbi:MobF family relaxase [Streptomyces sp. TR06-5]|uniref:MobF family relaxase n=1 Tax=Streptomyces sp. TR06-5 TaxID=3385976 RepID=UPI00399F3CBD